MVKNRISLRNISTVAASKTVVVEVPIGPRYHLITLEHGYSAGTNTVAAAATNISEVRVKVNGRVQRTFSGAQLRDLNILNGTAYDCQGVPNTAPGVSFPIFFNEPWRQTEDADRLAWPTNLWNSFQIEVDLGAASTPTLVASAVVDNLQVKEAPQIVKHIRQTFGASGTSFDISTIDRKDFLQQVTFYAPTIANGAAVTKVTMRKDGAILHELTKTANFALLTNSQMTPTASGRTSGAYDLVLDHDGLLNSAVNLNGSQSLTFTYEAGDTMSSTLVALVQRIGPAE